MLTFLQSIEYPLLRSATVLLIHSCAVLYSQQPGPFPIAHVDLAEFSLNALLTKKLYNSCPYVVADSF